LRFPEVPNVRRSLDPAAIARRLSPTAASSSVSVFCMRCLLTKKNQCYNPFKTAVKNGFERCTGKEKESRHSYIGTNISSTRHANIYKLAGNTHFNFDTMLLINDASPG
jgi:hypothetical protein